METIGMKSSVHVDTDTQSSSSDQPKEMSGNGAQSVDMVTGCCACPEFCEYLSHEDSLCQRCKRNPKNRGQE